jgi:hypothetical protein
MPPSITTGDLAAAVAIILAILSGCTVTILWFVNEKFKELEKTMASVTDPLATSLAALQAQVAQNTQVEGSAVTLIQGIAAQLAASANDPAAISALATQLNTSATALAAAVAANTPAAPSGSGSSGSAPASQRS